MLVRIKAIILDLDILSFLVYGHSKKLILCRFLSSKVQRMNLDLQLQRAQFLSLIHI